MKRLRFVDFCSRVLRLRLTNAQRVLALVAIDGVQPCALDGADREIARALFGDVDTIAANVRRVLVWSLGRGSGKTTLVGALLVYTAVTSSLVRVGPGMVPAAVVIAPRLSTAKIVIAVARELVRGAPELERLVADDDDTKEGFTLVRERRVRIAGFAASRGGVNVRGFDLLALVLEEAELFFSESDAAVTDRDSYNGALPRLLHGETHHAVFIGTPWPVPTLMGELCTKNHGNPRTALAAVGSTLTMRDLDPVLAEEIAKERALDPETTARERDCDRSATGAGVVFDPEFVNRAVDASLLVPVAPLVGAIGIAGDLAFVSDSSAVSGAQRDEWGNVAIVLLDELIPKPGAPLVPSRVAEHFASVTSPWRQTSRAGAFAIWLDGHYRESAREHFAKHGMRVRPLPEGTDGKATTYKRVQELLHASRLRLPNVPRLLSQMRSVTVKPLAGGGTRIESPRRVGSGHGDLVSAVVGAVHALERANKSSANAQPQAPMPTASVRAYHEGGELSVHEFFGVARAFMPPAARGASVPTVSTATPTNESAAVASWAQQNGLLTK